VTSAGEPGRDGVLLRELATAADPALGAHAARRPRAGRFEESFGEDPDRGFVVEAIHEGWQLHYGTPRAFLRMDDDLRLLGGDALFALGLERLTERGDLEAVAELADLISLSAQAVCEGRRDWAEELWRAAVEALASGPDRPAGSGARAAFERLAPPTSP
jgi:hypothetical protein